jgi:Family of unknown function (DUF7009)
VKLRIRGNSIRLRLSQSEVAQLAQNGRVNDSTRFSAAPEGRLSYTLESSPSAPEVFAGLSLSRGEIRITIPQSQTQEWANSELVGLQHTQPIDGDETLSILIEKDFQCLTPRPGEDQSDNFQNPLAGKKNCRHP